MTTEALWFRVLVGIGGAATALAVVEVPPPSEPALSRLPAMGLGLACGLALFAILSLQVPRVPPSRDPARWMIRLAFVVTWAAVEEILWRWLVLGVVATASGWPLALAASSLGFAAVHRVGKMSQLATGTTFGGVYLATGRLLAAVVAHAAYNLVLAEALARTRLRAHPT